jgi:hypothetical protein
MSGRARPAPIGRSAVELAGPSWNDYGVDHADPKDDLRGRLIEYEDLIRREQLNPSDADGSRESDLEEMREVLLARIREKTRG